MAVILACKTAFLDHAFQSCLLMHDSMGHSQRTEKRLGHLLEHKKLRSGNAAVITEVAPVRGQNQDRRAVNHAHLRQRPRRYEQTSNTGNKNDSPTAKSGAGAERDTVSLAGDSHGSEIGILPHGFS